MRGSWRRLGGRMSRGVCGVWCLVVVIEEASGGK